MRILEFHKRFPDESSCKAAFIACRQKEGVRCKKCGNTTHYWKKKREQWECKSCSHRTTIKSGTVMENSKLSFQYWLVGMHLLTCTKKSFSAKEVQRELGHNRYQPIWEMLHKIRSVMGLRDDLYNLNNELELDDGFFETVAITRDSQEPLKRGRGSQKQTTVLVMAESKVVEPLEGKPKHKHNKQLGFIKMKVIKGGFQSHLFTAVVKKNVESGSKINSDGSTSYSEFKGKYQHNPKVVEPKQASKLLPWVHTTISNAKRMLLDVHHRIDDAFLQNYLNAFVFKINRRYHKDVFDRVMIAAVSFRWNYLGERYG
jgi:hypothetical protein